MFHTIVREHERALLFRDGRLTDYLRPGRHRRWTLGRELKIRTYGVDAGWDVLSPELEKAVPTDEGDVLEVAEDQIALLSRHELPLAVLGPGRYLLWQVRGTVLAELRDRGGDLLDVPAGFRALVPDTLGLDVIVGTHERAVLFVDGELRTVLGPGRHLVDAFRRKVSVTKLELREQELGSIGQELITRDKVTLRLNLLLKHRIVDPVAAVGAVTDLRTALYGEMQIVAREVVGGVTVDGLLEDRVVHSARMRELIGARAKGWGVEVLRLDIKDVILPGDMKLLLNRVIEAEKQAAAQVIHRREEVAATRSLANTARMLENNPVLLRLKELEALKELAGSIPNLTVVFGGEELTERLRLVRKD